jgi:hypothetical protein
MYVPWRDEILHIPSASEFAARRKAQLADPSQQRAWSEKALSKHYDVEKQIDKLIVLTAARKKLQQQLGIPPTDDGYVDCGNRAALGSGSHSKHSQDA